MTVCVEEKLPCTSSVTALGWNPLIFSESMSLLVLSVPGRPAGGHKVSWRDPSAQRGQHQAGPTPLSAAEWSQWCRRHGCSVHLPDQPSGCGLFWWEPSALEHENSEERVSLRLFNIIEDLKINYRFFSIITGKCFSSSTECYIFLILKYFFSHPFSFFMCRYHSQLEGGRVPVHAFTFQEPENDPRNCCYLWAVQSAQDL